MLAKYLSRPFEQEFARLCQDHSSRRPRKDLDADLVLELSDLHGNGGLCDVYTSSACRKRFRLGYRQKGL
jgi:hypothetical protein